MARVFITAFMFTVMLTAFITISAAQKTCPKTGEFCGGFAGIKCCEGFECEIKDTSVADAGGKCKKTQSCQKLGEHCGGFTRIPYVCCEGFKCVLKNPKIADIGGTCQRSY